MLIEEKICYKVVTDVNGMYLSHNITDYDISNLRKPNHHISTYPTVLRYFINEETFPTIEGAKLFCFINLDDAVNYAREYWGHDKSVLECTCKGLSVYPYERIPCIGCVSHSYLPLLWEKLSKGQFSDGVDVPEGTYLADSVTPVKKICTFYDE